MRVVGMKNVIMSDGVYRLTDSGPVFQAIPAPSAEQLQTVLTRIITRILEILTRKGALIEEHGLLYLVDPDADPALAPLQAASCTYRTALGPRAGQKVLTRVVSVPRGSVCMPTRVAAPINDRHSNGSVTT